eukprot:c37710_g1_i1 orf=54-218(-)
MSVCSTMASLQSKHSCGKNAQPQLRNEVLISLHSDLKKANRSSVLSVSLSVSIH